MPDRTEFSPGEFCWVDLSAHDLAAAAAWYGGLFGWTHTMMESPGGGPPYAFFESGGKVIGGLGEMSDEMKVQGIPPMWNSYVATADCAATEAQVREHGGTVTVSTMEIPGHGKLTFFLDPEGASLAAWETLTDCGPPLLVNEPVSPCWNELMSRDVTKARDFYAQLFGWTYNDVPMGDVNYSVLQNSGKDGGGMMPMEGPMWEGVPAHWMLYFAVASCEDVAAKVEATGGKVIVPPTEIPVGEFSVLMDPQGAGFSVITLKDPPA